MAANKLVNIWSAFSGFHILSWLVASKKSFSVGLQWFEKYGDDIQEIRDLGHGSLLPAIQYICKSETWKHAGDWGSFQWVMEYLVLEGIRGDRWVWLLAMKWEVNIQHCKLILNVV